MSSDTTRSGVHFRITSGAHPRLPGEWQRILICEDPRFASIADEWLQSHHYSNILISPQGSPRSPDRNTAFLVTAEASSY
jgi:hypothetical protein